MEMGKTTGDTRWEMIKRSVLNRLSLNLFKFKLSPSGDNFIEHWDSREYSE